MAGYRHLAYWLTSCKL